MRPHTQVIPRPLGCAQRSGTRAVMRSFLLPDFHPETMINYFWLPLVRGNPPSFPRIRWKSFLGQRREGESQPLSDEFNSSDRSISRIFRESRHKEQVVEFSWWKEKRGGMGETRMERSVGNCWSVYYFVRRTIKFLAGVSISVPSILLAVYIILLYSPAKRKFYFWLKTSINNVRLRSSRSWWSLWKSFEGEKKKEVVEEEGNIGNFFNVSKEFFLMMSYDLIILIRKNMIVA